MIKKIIFKDSNGVTQQHDIGASADNIVTDSGQSVENVLAAKIDKISGKGLSANDYTTAEKDKLSGIADNANNYTHPSSHPASMITQDSDHRFVSDTDKNKLNSIKCMTDILIAASDSPDKFKKSADFICDGVNDHTEIQQAVYQLGSRGGKITLASGTYYPNNQVTIDSAYPNITIEGMGIGSTMLILNGINRVFNASNNSCTFRNFSISGNCNCAIRLSCNQALVDSVNMSGVQNAIVAYGSAENDSENVHDNYTITNVSLSNLTSTALDIKAFGCTISNCSLINGRTGIYLAGSNNTVTDCTLLDMTGNSINNVGSYNHITNNYIDKSNGSGILLSGASGCIVSDNLIKNCNQGIQSDFSQHCKLSNNICVDSVGTGLLLNNTNHCAAVNNTFVRGTGQTSDYTDSKHTIKIEAGCENNLIMDNFIPGKNYTNTGESTTNVFVNNITA